MLFCHQISWCYSKHMAALEHEKTLSEEVTSSCGKGLIGHLFDFTLKVLKNALSSIRTHEHKLCCDIFAVHFSDVHHFFIWCDVLCAESRSASSVRRSNTLTGQTFSFSDHTHDCVVNDCELCVAGQQILWKTRRRPSVSKHTDRVTAHNTKLTHDNMWQYHTMLLLIL